MTDALTTAPWDVERIRAAVSSTLVLTAADVLFFVGAEQSGVTFEELGRRFEQVPARADDFCRWLAGSEAYRYAGLRLLVQALAEPAAPAQVLEGPWHITSTVVVSTPLRVEGDVAIDEGGVLLALGGVEIEGTLIADPHEYTLVAGPRVAMHNLLSGGELLALDELVVEESALLSRSEHACRSPLMRADTLVDFERDNVFTEVEVNNRVSRASFEAAAKAAERALGDEPR